MAEPRLSASLVLMFVVLLASALAAKDKEAGKKTGDDTKVKDKKILSGGIMREPMPDKVRVTEEIWFDIQIDNYYDKSRPYMERITIACFGQLFPVTCTNFITLAKGYKKGKELLTYKDTKINKIVVDFLIQMGDVEFKTRSNAGDGGMSIYGKKFHDESFALSHNSAGWVSMANYGKDTNGSQFFILLQPARWLDGKHVVFAKVKKGMKVLRTVSEEATDRYNRPIRNVFVVDCGVTEIASQYDLTAAQLSTDDDIV